MALDNQTRTTSGEATDALTGRWRAQAFKVNFYFLPQNKSYFPVHSELIFVAHLFMTPQFALCFSEMLLFDLTDWLEFKWVKFLKRLNRSPGLVAPKEKQNEAAWSNTKSVLKLNQLVREKKSKYLLRRVENQESFSFRKSSLSCLKTSVFFENMFLLIFYSSQKCKRNYFNTLTVWTKIQITKPWKSIRPSSHQNLLRFTCSTRLFLSTGSPSVCWVPGSPASSQLRTRTSRRSLQVTLCGWKAEQHVKSKKMRSNILIQAPFSDKLVRAVRVDFYDQVGASYTSETGPRSDSIVLL